jgi:Xaa-Pro aminopeptidase
VGTLVVSVDHPDYAGLWVDSRYWEQAERQLEGTGIAAVKWRGPQSGDGHVEWLARTLPAGSAVGIDAASIGMGACAAMAKTLAAAGLSVVAGDSLLEDVWADRPPMPESTVFEHALPFAVASRADKLAAVRQHMRDAGADWHFTSALDEVAWLCNIRGADVPFNPVVVAHALIGTDGVTVFMRGAPLAATIADALAADGIALAPYADMASALGALPEGASLLLDPGKVTVAVAGVVGKGVKVVEAMGPCALLKSRKSAGQAGHIRDAMVQDAAALAEFFTWLERTVEQVPVRESDIDEQITAARARRSGFVSRSFATIAAFGPNGALPHYRAVAGQDRAIEGDGLLLIDSGGQYLGGTTDITRMVAIGTPTGAQKRDVTLALKGMIALSKARFPHGTRAPMLDAIARAPMWADCVDYGHGTGHGVGYFLNVHEGPQSIAYRATPTPETAMEPGMVTSIEPGVYRPGQWGCRVENLVLCREVAANEFGKFLSFETLTLCPIDLRCVDAALLTPDEAAWLDDYHATVWTRVSPHVQGDALSWLALRTRPLSGQPG